MLRKILTIALPVAAAAAVATFFPATPAQAYPAICDTTFKACIADLGSFEQFKQCYIAFETCSGGATPPPVDYPSGVADRR